ncbi:MAG: glyoxalase/bleomycin resistance/dioxygenase family protein [Ignavibacteria bacterium]|nr:glyoxalase/bleomycin resistance/dioxygenase family protein [Ignavibacteria bacterium]
MNIAELQIYTSNIETLKQFYTNTLRLEQSYESNNSFSLKIGTSTLTFNKSSSNEKPYYHYAINIPENQIHDAIQWLSLKVSLIEYEKSSLIDFPNWNAQSVYFYDPAGNIVELIARHDLDNASQELFSSKSLLSISEIGMPVEGVKAFHDTLSTQLGEKLWSGNLDTFAAIGDQEGLFIVVTTHRNWFPTNKPCYSFPLKVKLRNYNYLSGLFQHSIYEIIAEPIQT